jgi:biopolymer transport protein ExbB/TolQ
MVWVVVWSVLVLGTLVGAFVLGRDLWRRFRALVAELREASQVLGQLAEHASTLAEQAQAAERAARAAREAALLPDPDEARDRWALLREQARERRELRRERDRRTREAWRAYTR